MFLFNIQRFSTHDGPGIRTTVFFKGCPLRCLWCHNPESQRSGPEVMHNSERCVLCGKCVSGCPSQAIAVENGTLVTDAGKCTGCGLCADECLNCAREVAGREYTVGQVIDTVLRDRTYYSESGGGVTFSGGECMSAPKELTSLMKECRQWGIHTAVDTCGFCKTEDLTTTLPYTNLYLYDIKCVDPKLHRELTGADNGIILKNLRFLKENGANIWLRLPLIVGANCEDREISDLLELADEIRPAHVSLLPYHNTGSFKYLRLNREAESFTTPKAEWLEELRDRFEKAGHSVKIGN